MTVHASADFYVQFLLQFVDRFIGTTSRHF